MIVRWLQIVAALDGRLRKIPFAVLVRASFLFSVVIIAVHIPGRWFGERTAEVADIPLQPLSAHDAAALLAGSENGRVLARIARIDRDQVVVHAEVYLLPDDASRGECGGRVTHRGKVYQVCSSSWENYHDVHAVNRSALERELGRQLTSRDVAKNPSDSRASFSSQLLPMYFTIEVVGLTILLITVASIVCYLSSRLLAPPLILVVALGAVMLVSLYSPAFVDADWFYQRIAVEEFIGGRGLLGASFAVLVTTSLVLSAITVPLFAIQLFARRMRRRTA